jgi:hypothetical protein
LRSSICCGFFILSFFQEELEEEEWEKEEEEEVEEVEEVEEEEDTDGKRYKILLEVPPSIEVIGLRLFILFVVSEDKKKL